MKIVSLFLILFIYSCTNKPAGTVTKADTGDVENFAQFDVKFNSDSLFQISRIKFPLEGHGRDGIMEKEWINENWEMLRTAVGDTTDIRDFKHRTIVTDTTVTEKYWMPDSGFSLERRFKLFKGKWYLVYYTDVNL